MTADAPTTLPPPLRRWAAPIAVGLALALLSVVGGKALAGRLVEFTEWVRGLGSGAPIVFGLGYAVACVLLIPASFLTLAAGAIFGWARGAAVVFVAASAGATMAFLLARTLLRPRLERRFVADRRFLALSHQMAGRGRLVAFLLRLSPVFPFSLLNYALGLTRISLADYLIALIGILPGTLAYSYYGHVGGDLVALAAGQVAPPGDGGTTQTALRVVGVLATVVATAVVTRLAKRALKDAAPG